MLLLLRGRLDILIFNTEAEIVQRLPMSIAEPIVQIPRATWHSGVALESETLVLEVKAGLYRPNEFAEWASREGEPARFVSWAASARDGHKW
jgi:cupin fold WbuC family metalloprotein